MSSKEVKVRVIGDVSDLLKKLEQAKDSIEDLGKGANKSTNKGIDNLNNDLDELRKNAERTADSLDDLYNATRKPATNNFSDMADDITDVSKKINIAVDDIKDFTSSLKNVDSSRFNDVSESMADVNRAMERSKNYVEDYRDSFKTLNNINLNNLKDDFGDISRRISPLTNDIKDFGKQVDLLDKASLDKLKKSMIDMDDTTTKIHNSIKDAGENLFEELDVNKLNKFKNSFGDITTSSKKAESSLAGTVAQTAALGSSVIIGVAGLSKLKNKIAETAAESAKIKLAMKDITDAMGNCALKMTSLADESEKLYGKITKASEKAFEAQSKLDHATKFNNTEDIEKYSKEVIKYAEEVKKLGNEHHELSNKTNEVKAEVEQLVKKFAELSTQDKEVDKALKDMVEMFNKSAKAARESGQAVDDIDYDKLINEALEAAKANDKVADSTKKAGDSLDKLKDKASGIKDAFSKLKDLDFSGAFKSFKDSGKGIFEDLGKGIESAGSKLSDFGSKLSGLGGIGGKLGSVLSSAGSGMSSLGSSTVAAAGGLASVTGIIAGVGAALYGLYEAGKKQFFEGLINIKNKLQPAIDAIKSFGREAISAFEEITNTQLDLSSLMQIGPEFEYQMQRVGSIAGSNDKQLQQLTDTARKLGSTTQFSASQVGEAFEYMAMAGYSTEEMLASIDDTLNLAIISGGDLGTVSDIVTDGLTALGMSAADTGEFVDKLAATITSSNTTVELFGETLKQVGALAGSLGVNMTDLSTATGLMANAGVKGSRAGTSLKNVLSNMASPTDKQAAALQKLGLTADETGSYLKTTADGNVDLAATMKSLMKATEGMDKTQQAAILTQIAGKEAIAGLMSIMNQGEAAWDELSTTIENSTGKVQYWNECMSLAGKSGDEAVKLIDNMKQVFSEVESEAQAAGMSTEDLANAIALLGDDGKVTSDNVRDLIKVIDDMGTATGEQEKKWRALDKTGKSALNTNFNYDKSVAAITADTQGLTQAQKESMIAELGKAKTYKEAIDIAKKYSQGNIDMTKTIERVSLADYSYSERIKFLRDQLKGLSDEERKAALENLGLGNAFDEVNEIVDMSDKEFDAYTKNLETVQSMSEQLANAMDEITKGSLLSLAYAIQNVAISAFESLKPAIQNASDALTEFFDTWHNGDKNEFTFTGLENGLKGLEQKIRGAIPNIQQAVADLFSGLDRFVNGGSLDSILKIGTDVITGICKGISEAKENGSLDSAIDGAIKKICRWVEDNGPTIEKAGLDILDSIKTGIENNKDEINSALDVVAGVISSWANSSAELRAAISDFADVFADVAMDQIGIKIREKATDVVSAIKDMLTSINPLEFLPIIGDWFDTSKLIREQKNNKNDFSLIDLFGKLPTLEEAKKWVQDKFKNFHPIQWIKEVIFGKNKGKSKDGNTTSVKPKEIFGKLPTFEECKKWVQDKFKNFHPIQWIKEAIFGKGGTTSKAQDSGNSPIKPEQLIKLPSLEDAKKWVQSKIGNWHPIQWIKEALFGKGGTTSKAQNSGNSPIKPEHLIKLPSMDEIKGWIEGKIGDFHPIKWIQEKWNQVKDFGNDALKWVDNLIPDDLGTKISEKLEKVIGDNWFTDTIEKIFNKKDGKKADVKDLLNIDNTKLEETKKVLESLGETATAQAGVVKTAFADIQNSARTSFVGLSNIARNQFINVSNIVRNQMVNCANIVRNQAVNMANIFRNQFINMANIVRNQIVNCTNIVRNQAVNMANIFRNQFTSMSNVARNQMVNVSNIIRNQAVNWSNIIRNQVQSARNTMTSSFISMRNVARNQMVAISNIIRNQAVTWSNIIRNQAANMRSAMTSAFAGMAASARAGMANVLSVVRSYMAQIRSETSKTMTMNFQVSKTVTTTNVTKNVTKGLRNTMGAISRGSAPLAAPQAMSIGGYATSMSSIGGLAAGGSITLDVPLYLDGKEVARATAVYNEQELAKLAKRNNRKRGE